MSVYEARKYAVNQVRVPDTIRKNVVCGSASVCQQIIALLKDKKRTSGRATAAIDGWYGVDWTRMSAGLRKAAKAQGLSLTIISTADGSVDDAAGNAA